MPTLKTKLREARLLAGLTQEELAAKAGVRRETILHLESGRYNPSLKLAMDLAHLLHTGVEDLFWFEEKVRPD